MGILIDTHILIWALCQPTKLSAGIRKIIDQNDVIVSSASFLEIQIKRKLGKLQFDVDLSSLVQDGIIHSLDITYEHSLATYDLPLIHKDPFDRLLIAQSSTEGIPLITADKEIQKYDFAFIPA